MEGSALALVFLLLLLSFVFNIVDAHIVVIYFQPFSSWGYSDGSMISPPVDKLALIVTSSHSPNSAASCGGMLTVTNPLRLTRRLLKTGLNSMFQTISRIVFKHLRNTL